MATKTLPAIRSALLLARGPIVVPELSKFEAQYIKYQGELDKRLMWTFPYYYYFKKGTMSEYKFQAAQKRPVSKQPGVWFPEGIPDIRHNRERSKKQDVILPKNETSEEDSSISRPVLKNSIITPADEQNDTKSLERQLRRTLYLVVKTTKDSDWKFPSFPYENGRLLHEVAESGIRNLGGNKINTWTVSRKPVKVIKTGNSNGESLEFLFKSRILTGLFLSTNPDIEYKWLTKEEIKDCVDRTYYENTEFLLDN